MPQCCSTAAARELAASREAAGVLRVRRHLQCPMPLNASFRGPPATRDTKLESTVRYLGIEVDDALEMAERSAKGLAIYTSACSRGRGTAKSGRAGIM